MGQKQIQLDIDALMKFDAIAEAEKMLHVERWDKDKKTAQDVCILGMGLAREQGAAMQTLMNTTNDTTNSMSINTYLNNIREFGFEEVYTEEFYCITAKRNEEMFVFVKKDEGLVLTVDSFCDRVNASNVHYNWKPNIKPKEEWKKSNEPEVVDKIWEVTSSGSRAITWGLNNTDTWVWSGNHDAREAVRHKIQRLRDCGTFITPWVERPLLCGMVTRAEFKHAKKANNRTDYNKIDETRKTRLYRLPLWVEELMGVEDI